MGFVFILIIFRSSDYNQTHPIMISITRTVTLVFALLFLISCGKDTQTTIIHNINGYSNSAAGLITFEAIAISEGKVMETGSHEALRDSYPNAELIDGEGRTMLPGLIDAHAHVMGLGDAILNVNLMGLTSLESTLETIAGYAREYGDLEWISGRGWNQVLWEENRFPTAAELDRAVSDRPVWLSRVDGHAGWANTRAIEIAGITRDTPDPDGGAIIRDENGDATGVFIDRAMGLIRRHIPEQDDQYRVTALEAALEEIRRMGMTGVHDAGTGVEAFRLMKKFADEGRLTTRIYGMISGAGEVFDELSKDGPVIGYAGDRLYLRSVKLYSDGALGSRGAALIEDYSDDPGNRGLLFNDADEFTQMIGKVASKGYQAGVHAIGDRGNRTVLDAFANVREKQGDRGLRHRIEHSQIVNLDDIPRFKELGIIASMQPTHATSDMNMAEDRVGPVRIRGAYAWRTFLDQGTVIAAGSDFPVELSNPFHGLYSAVTRADHDGNPDGGWYPEQILTREEALHGFTLGAAYAGYMEDIAGSLEPGKWADFILIDRDYFTVPEEEIWQIRVLETWLAGDRVYEAGTY
jgi:predicted amidohydrolase YtcJ